MATRREMIGWGLVGTGRHAAGRIAPAITAASNARLVGVSGRETAKAAAFATRFDTRAFGSLAEMLADSAIDAVFLTTPNDLHAPQTLEAAAAKRHVLCEKPLALSPADCRAMIQACREAGVKLGVGFHLRQHEAHRRARDLIGSGVLGEPSFARAQWAVDLPGPREGWWREPRRAGAGSLYGTGVHLIDLLRFVLGREVEAVAAWTDATPDQPLDSRVLALLRFAGGLEAMLVSARPFGQPDNDLVVHGPEGRLAARNTLWADYGGSLELTAATSSQRMEFTDGPPFRMYIDQVERFGQALRGDGEVTATGHDGLVAALVSQAIQNSSAEGRTVVVASPD